MAQFGTGEIDRLIDAGVGDADELRQIRRAIMRDEVVSAAEHEYVMRLVAAHLGSRRDRVRSKAQSPPRAPQMPMSSVRHAVGPQKRGRRIVRIAGSVVDRVRQRPTKKTVIAAVIIAAIAVSAGAYGVSMTAGTGTAPIRDAGIMLYTDKAAYTQGEVIVVSGRAEPGSAVSLAISGPGGTLWEETAVAGSDGSYSAMEFAGGDGWQAGSAHTVSASGQAGEHAVEFLFGAMP